MSIVQLVVVWCAVLPTNIYHANPCSEFLVELVLFCNASLYNDTTCQCVSVVVVVGVLAEVLLVGFFVKFIHSFIHSFSRFVRPFRFVHHPCHVLPFPFASFGLLGSGFSDVCVVELLVCCRHGHLLLRMLGLVRVGGLHCVRP